MGKAFFGFKKVVKEVDPELVEIALSTVVYTIVKQFPQYGDQLAAVFEYLGKIVSDEDLTEEEFHQKIEKALMDIGVDDEYFRHLIGYFLRRLEQLADKYLDVQEGFTKEEREAWAKLFFDLSKTAMSARKNIK